MAIIKTGAIVTDIRGKLGGHFFSKNKSSSFMATKYKPKNDATFAQSVQRSMFNTVSQLWRNLTNAQRLNWNLAAANFKYKDRFGDAKSNSGYWLFIKINLNLVLTEQGFVLDVPMFNSPLPWSFDPTPFQWSANNILISQDNFDTNAVTAIYATPMLSAGIANPLNYFRHIINVTAQPNNIFNVFDEYTQHFTFPTLNSNLWFGFKKVDVTGIATKFVMFNFFDTINS